MVKELWMAKECQHWSYSSGFKGLIRMNLIKASELCNTHSFNVFKLNNADDSPITISFTASKHDPTIH